MSEPAGRPTLTIYRRPGCHLCDDAGAAAARRVGHACPCRRSPVHIEHVDISGDPDLEARHGMRIPVFALGAEESDLVTTGRQVRDFLERALPGSSA